MALNEIQTPEPATFKNEIQQAATQMNGIMNAWRDISKFIIKMVEVDITAVGITDQTTIDDLIDFRVAMREVTNFYDGIATTQTNVPAAVVDKIRRMK